MENYSSLSLLPICGKSLEMILFNKMFKFFIKIKLISSNWYDWKPDDFSINQMLSITNEIYECFDVEIEVTSVILYISRTFNKV